MNLYYINPKKLNPIEDYSQERVDWLLKKIKSEMEWRVPLAISIEHNLVMDGHHRLQVSLRLNLKKVPCYFYSYNEINPYSLRKEIEVNSDIIIDNFLKSVIFPYKTAKHDLPFQNFKPIMLEDLR